MDEQCLCNNGTYIDDEGKSRCNDCDRITGTALGRYWDSHDPETMSEKDWELYGEIDFS